MLGGGKLEYYKSMGGTTKRGSQILRFQWGEAKGGGRDFWLKFNGGVGNRGANYVFVYLFRLDPEQKLVKLKRLQK